MCIAVYVLSQLCLVSHAVNKCLTLPRDDAMRVKFGRIPTEAERQVAQSSMEAVILSTRDV